MKPLRTGVIFLVLLVGVAVVTVSGDSSISTGIGVNFFRYDTTYLTALSATYHHELQGGLELNIGGDFNITTRKDADGEIKPKLLLPVNVGLNFTFPHDRVTFLFGTGLTPVFNINTDETGADEFRFYMGPYLKGAMRVRVHPIMSWFVEYQQDLLIGGDQWINSASRVMTGINFAIPAKN
ncbi:MAG: hypothetical protein WCY01_07405 [Alkalispirochaeta sp.]|jgi:hypothetical protein